jgi:hypothetical protein
MFPATTLSEVEWFLSRRTLNSSANKRWMLGLLFARPSVKLAEEQVFPNLEYFDRRSFTHIDFFCAGVARGEMRIADHQFSPHDYIRVTAPDPRYRSMRDYESRSEYLYSDAAFCQFCEEVEGKTTWRYSGETDLLLLDCEIHVNRAEVDFSQVIAMNLDEMSRVGLIASVSAFVEAIIASVKPTNVMNRRSVVGTSDRLGGRAVTQLTFEALMKLLPPQASQAVKAVRYFRVGDLSAP